MASGKRRTPTSYECNWLFVTGLLGLAFLAAGLIAYFVLPRRGWEGRVVSEAEVTGVSYIESRRLSNGHVVSSEPDTATLRYTVYGREYFTSLKQDAVYTGVGQKVPIAYYPNNPGDVKVGKGGWRLFGWVAFLGALIFLGISVFGLIWGLPASSKPLHRWGDR